MPSAEHTVTIRRPVGEVFAFIENHENDPRWRAGVLDIKRGSGNSWQQGMKGPLGRRIAGDFDVTQNEPNRRHAFHVTAGPVQPDGVYELADENGSTRVTFSLRADLDGAKKLMAPLVARTMKQEVGALDRLKTVLESGG
jgi:uncharacterized membrane protein